LRRQRRRFLLVVRDDTLCGFSLKLGRRTKLNGTAKLRKNAGRSLYTGHPSVLISVMR